MSISIIIPTFNDNEALAKLLHMIRSWHQQPHEIIVVDAAANKECALLCKTNNAIWLSFKKNRGAQQKFGASHASGHTLWFLHADASPDPKALEYITAVIESGVDGGFFRFKFNSKHQSITKTILTYFTNWRSRHFIAYGDQGIFVRKNFYEAMNGHADQPLFEEVQLIKALRKNGKLAISKLSIGVSPRRWEKDGYWRRTLHNRFLAIAFSLGVSADKLTQWYTQKKVQLPESKH